MLIKPKKTDTKKDVISSDPKTRKPIDLEFEKPSAKRNLGQLPSSAKRNLGQLPEFVEDEEMLVYSDDEEEPPLSGTFMSMFRMKSMHHLLLSGWKACIICLEGVIIQIFITACILYRKTNLEMYDD